MCINLESHNGSGNPPGRDFVAPVARGLLLLVSQTVGAKGRTHRIVTKRVDDFVAEFLTKPQDTILLGFAGRVVLQRNRGRGAGQNRISPNAFVVANAPAFVNFSNLKMYHNKKGLPGTRRGGWNNHRSECKGTTFFLISKTFSYFFIKFMRGVVLSKTKGTARDTKGTARRTNGETLIFPNFRFKTLSPTKR